MFIERETGGKEDRLSLEGREVGRLVKEDTKEGVEEGGEEGEEYRFLE